MKIKVCGITSFEQLQQLQDFKVDFAGLIFYEKSKRFVGDKLQNHKSEIRKLELEKVGVFVNADKTAIQNATDDYGLSYVQLHGKENAEFCEEVRKLVKVIKAIQVDRETKLREQLEQYRNACDYFLFDTATKNYGGSGLQFDWEILEEMEIVKPFFLSGGIGPGDVEKIQSFRHPELFAIDINSRFEVSPGTKNMELVKTFVHAINGNGKG